MTDFPIGSVRAERAQLLRKGDRLMKKGDREGAANAYNDAALLDAECVREQQREMDGEKPARRRKEVPA